MGVCKDLIALIKDHTHRCRARVRINSGYSSPFHLLHGVRQGDPLSCLLYAFSLEPLSHRLRRKIHGISVMNLPPAKLMMYVDDTNLFLSAAEDDVEDVAKCLEDTSYAIGCKFNLDKTDVLPVGSARHKATARESGVALPGAYVLAPDSPLRILGVWIGCWKQAGPRWAQILTHTRKLIGQWNAIGASIQNRVLITKLLMQSRCYYLLDGNGVPPAILNKLSALINRFVRGRYSLLPYRMMAPPLAEGGLNFPSLKHRKEAYDLKFLGDLTQGDQSLPWKAWTHADLRRASTAMQSTERMNPNRYPKSRALHRNLDPILQRAHTKYGDLEPRVRHAVMAARRARVNLQSCTPSAQAHSSTPAEYHHATTGLVASRNSNLSLRSITTVRQLVRPTLSGRRHGRLLKSHTPIEYTPSEEENTDPLCILPWEAPPEEQRAREWLLSILLLTDWHPQRDHRAANRPQGKIATWQDQADIRDCLRAYTDYRSNLAPQCARAGPRNSRHPTLPFLLSPDRDIAHGPILNRVTHIYTDGSAMNNDSPAECTSAAAWVSDSGASDQRRITGMPSSNNVAEVTAIAMALQAWQLTNLHIHTDSKIAQKLLEGGLLELECNGWIDTPWTAFPPRGPPQSMRNVLRHLHLVRAHQGSLSVTWVKVHTGHPLNEAADDTAKSALTSDDTIHLPALCAQAGWTDHAPVRGSTPLDVLTKQVVRNNTTPPLSEAKCAPFLEAWSACLLEMTGTALDAGLHAPRVWKLNVPTRLQELLWKDITRSLPIGTTWFGTMERGRTCSCGAELSLTHIWTGCDTHNLTPLLQTLRDRLPALPPAAPAWAHPWYPLLALREMESARRVGKKAAKELRKSWPDREWAIGSYLWLIWTNCMREVHGEGFAPPWRLCAALEAAIDTPPDLHRVS